MTYTLPSIPAKINCKISELSTHEYWGEEFANDGASYVLVQKENGKYVLVFGGAFYFNSVIENHNGYVVLEHTQSRAKIYGKAICIVNAETAQDTIDLIGKDNKIATWTLK